MAIIDIHAHWVPYEYREAIEERGEWRGMGRQIAEYDLVGMRLTAEQRLDDMDALGVDMQMLSPQVGFYQYDREVDVTVEIAKRCNDSIIDLVERFPNRFSGVGTVAMQSIPAAVGELRRVLSAGLKGIEISDHVLGSTYEEEKYLPFWAAVEELGAIVFFHQGFDHRYYLDKFRLDNSIGLQYEHAMNFGVLSTGGVLDRFPSLKMIFAHGGGAIPWIVARMDKVARGFALDDTSADISGYVPPYDNHPPYLSQAKLFPSEYLKRFFFDCVTYSETNLRFLIDAVGADHVLLGSDIPCPMVLTDSARWIQSLTSLTLEEKAAILGGNAVRLLQLGDM